jgi:hypothetical protein
MRVRLCVNRTVSDASMQVRYIRFQYMYPENTPGKTPVSPVKHPSVPREHPLAEHPSGHTMRENTHKAPLGGVVRGALGVFCLLCTQTRKLKNSYLYGTDLITVPHAYIACRANAVAHMCTLFL